MAFGVNGITIVIDNTVIGDGAACVGRAILTPDIVPDDAEPVASGDGNNSGLPLQRPFDMSNASLLPDEYNIFAALGVTGCLNLLAVRHGFITVRLLRRLLLMKTSERIRQWSSVLAKDAERTQK